MKSIILKIFIFLCCTVTFAFGPKGVFPQNANITIDIDKTLTYAPQKERLKDVFQSKINGVVIDKNRQALLGAKIIEKGTTNSVQTDFDGNFSIIVTDLNAILVVSYIGFKPEEISLAGKTEITVVLKLDTSSLDELVVMGLGTVKKESVLGAVSTIKPSELKTPSNNLTTALTGRLSGVVGYQTSGEPNQNNAELFIRGIASFSGQNKPLILIDGVELSVDNLASLQADDIESFSILKDPTTTSIYGLGGANGIVLVTTKSGYNGKTKVSLRVENSFNTPISVVDLADPITHMRLQNEANRTRGYFPIFSEEKIVSTTESLDSSVYPAVDWFDKLFKNWAASKRINLNVSGGSKKMRYYVAGSFNSDDGLLKVNKTNNFNNNIKLKRYILRSNININLYKNTEMIVRLHSTIDDYTGPLQGGNTIYNSAVHTSPIRFSPVLRPDGPLKNVSHITFGNDLGPKGSSTGNNGTAWYNPYAELHRGYKEYKYRFSSVQLELKQNLKSILPGLSARFLGNSNTTSYFENRRFYKPYFYRVLTPNSPIGYYTLARTSEGSELLKLSPDHKPTKNSVLYMELATDYKNTFADKHNVSSLLALTTREFLDGSAKLEQLSLPSRNLTLAGRFNYDYDNIYFIQSTFGYSGSEKFAKKNRFGFFPSFGVGWLVSNETFFKSDFISRLKFRASFGWVGNEQIYNNEQNRFLYLSKAHTNIKDRGYVFGKDLNQNIDGVSFSRYENNLLTWETSEKINIGMDLNLFDDAIQFRADIFQDNRTNILQNRIDIPSTLGLQSKTQTQTNVGKVLLQGIDASLDINHYFNKDLWLKGRATFLYSDNEYTVFEEPDFSKTGNIWLSNIGNNLSVTHGYIAERLFVDDKEALNSPKQFGTAGEDYGGGDIKYRDLNNDGIITALDKAPIGKPLIPKITYGFGVSVGYKRLDISMFFQGLAETSFFINPVKTAPFINTLNGTAILDGNGKLSENGLLKAYANDHWSEDNKNVYAIWPRLSTKIVKNNTETSTWWLRDGSFLKLKQVEIGFNLLIKSLKNKLNLNRLRIYATGNNLVTWSKFKLWDPELKGMGLNYPLQRTVNLGLQVGF